MLLLATRGSGSTRCANIAVKQPPNEKPEDPRSDIVNMQSPGLTLDPSRSKGAFEILGLIAEQCTWHRKFFGFSFFASVDDSRLGNTDRHHGGIEELARVISAWTRSANQLRLGSRTQQKGA